MSDPPEVLVIGGGVIGCWTAWHLQQIGGVRVTLVDRGAVGSSASWANCGYICPSHVHPLCGPGAVREALAKLIRFNPAFSIAPRWDPSLWKWLIAFARHCTAADFDRGSQARHALLASSMDLYRKLAQRHAERLRWQQRGLLLVHRSAANWNAYRSKADELREQFGLEVQRLDGAQLRKLEPALRENLAGGWYFPGDAHLSASDLTRTLMEEIVKAGGVVRENCEITQVHQRAGAISAVTTAAGESLSAERFVFATGAEAARFAPALGCRIPVIPGKGYSITMQTPAGAPKTPMIFEQDHVAVTPLGESFRIGSTMQLAGFSRTLPRRRIDCLKKSAREHLSTPLPQQPGSSWYGWRPMTPDDLPCIDRAPGAENAWIVTGNGMIGMATGAASGQLAAELVLDRIPHIDPRPYRLSRFGG